MLDWIRIILVEPAGPLNVGSVARVMKNFGLEQLVLVNPNCDPLGAEARQMAVHGVEVLEQAQRVSSLAVALEGCAKAIATSGRDRLIPLPLGTPRQMLPWLWERSRPETMAPADLAQPAPAALIFGREDSGLNNAELHYAQRLVQIPSGEAYASLNLAQAVAVCCYELRCYELHRNALYCDALHRDALHRDALHRDALHRDALHRDAFLNDDGLPSPNPEVQHGPDPELQHGPNPALPSPDPELQHGLDPELQPGGPREPHPSGPVPPPSIPFQEVPSLDKLASTQEDEREQFASDRRDWQPPRQTQDQEQYQEPPQVYHSDLLASLADLDRYYKQLEQLLLRIGYLYPHTAARRMEKLRRLYNRAQISRQELAMLQGMIRQVDWAVNHAVDRPSQNQGNPSGGVDAES